MPASDPSTYEEILIESGDGSKSVDLRSGVSSIEYYEDILERIPHSEIIQHESYLQKVLSVILQRFLQLVRCKMLWKFWTKEHQQYSLYLLEELQIQELTQKK